MSHRPFLAVCASHVEGAPLARRGALVLGTGKAAAAATMSELIAHERPRAVLLFGVGGAFPARHALHDHGLAPGSTCMIGSDLLADDGVMMPEGFHSMSELDFGENGPWVMDPERTATAAQLLGVPVLQAATVSTCSATEALSAEIARRSVASVESMEGAAVALVCFKHRVPFLQLRAISNFTGDRARGEWNLEQAVQRLAEAVTVLMERMP